MDHTTRKHLATVSALFAACAWLSGCGGGGTTADPASTSSLAAQDQATASRAPAPAPPSHPPSAAPAPAPAPSPTTPPRIAAVYYVNPSSASQQQLAAKFNLAIVSMYPGMSLSSISANVAAIKALNPSIKLGNYVILNEARASAQATDADYPAVQELNHNGLWAYSQPGGTLTTWTSAYPTYEVNLTAWAPTDANGQPWTAWKAQWDNSTLFNGTGFDYVFVDNVFYQPRVSADWKRTGSNQSATDPTVQAAYRQGYAAYWAQLRALNGMLKIMGNVDGDLSQPEFSQQLDGAFNECLLGKSWSIESWGGWQAMMTRYRATLANTRVPHDVVFQACGSTADPALARYGIASALMDNGYFAFTVDGTAVPPWFDEYSAPLGTAVDAPPTAPTASGIWVRHYSNGIALVNPTSSTLSIDIGSGWRHLQGTVDPTVNDGQPVSTVTLAPRTGLVVVRQ